MCGCRVWASHMLKLLGNVCKTHKFVRGFIETPAQGRATHRAVSRWASLFQLLWRRLTGPLPWALLAEASLSCIHLQLLCFPGLLWMKLSAEIRVFTVSRLYLHVFMSRLVILQIVHSEWLSCCPTLGSKLVNKQSMQNSHCCMF